MLRRLRVRSTALSSSLICNLYSMNLEDLRFSGTSSTESSEDDDEECRESETTSVKDELPLL